MAEIMEDICNIEKLIENDEFDNIEKQVQESVYPIIRSYKRGILSDDEYRNEIMRVLWKRDNKNILAISYNVHIPFHYDFSNWERMLADWNLFIDNKEPVSQLGRPWLVYNDDYKKEAEPYLKVKFFRFMQAIHMPIEYWEQPPTSIKKYQKRIDHTYGDGVRWAIYSTVRNYGDILNDNLAIGRTCCFTDYEECVYHISIDNFSYDKYGGVSISGHGHIDGYTTELERELSVNISRTGHLLCIFTITFSNNLDAEYLPATIDKWKPYFEWEKDCQERIQKKSYDYIDTLTENTLLKV